MTARERCCPTIFEPWRRQHIEFGEKSEIQSISLTDIKILYCIDSIGHTYKLKQISSRTTRQKIIPFATCQDIITISAGNVVPADISGKPIKTGTANDTIISTTTADQFAKIAADNRIITQTTDYRSAEIRNSPPQGPENCQNQTVSAYLHLRQDQQALYSLHSKFSNKSHQFLLPI